VVLSYPPLGIDLPSAGSRLLLLLVGLLLIWEGLHSWLGHCCPHHDRRGGLDGQSALWEWCGDGRVYRGHHVAPLKAGGPKLAPAPDVVPFSSEDSSRVMCREGDPLWIIPTNMAPESRPWGRNLGGQSDQR
jgi:hypothetical protein